MKKDEQQRIAQDLIDRYGAQSAKDIAAEIYTLCFRFVPEDIPEKASQTLPLPSKTDAQRLAAMMLRAGVELVTPMQPRTRRTVQYAIRRQSSETRRHRKPKPMGSEHV